MNAALAPARGLSHKDGVMKASILLLTGLAAWLGLAGCSSSPSDAARQVSILTGAAPRPAEADSYSAFLVARFAALTNDPRRALSSYESAFRAAPENTELAERAVFAALMAGAFEDAVRLSRAGLQEKEAASSLVRLTLAVDAVREGRAHEVATTLSTGRFSPFNRTMAVNLRAWAALDAEGGAAARKILMSGKVGDPVQDAIMLTMMGLTYLAEGDDDRALAVFEAIGEGGPRLAVATEAHARLLASRGQLIEAIDMLAAFRREVGPNPAVDSLRRRLEAGEHVDVFRPDLRQGAALGVYMPAAAFATHTRSDLAGVYFVMALALDADLDIARTLWAEALDASGRRSDAIHVLEQVATDSPFYATARGQMAWVLRRQEKNARALAVAEDALAHYPDRDLKVQLGDLFTTLGRDEEAEALFSEVIQADAARGQTDWRLFFARGAARERLGRWPLAETDLQEALRLNPDNADILNHLGYSWIDRGINLEEGMRLISRAVDLEPRSGLIVDSLGWAYYRMGDYARAVLHLERAVELRPGDPVINDHLGDAYWRVGRRLEARYQWQRALRLDPDSPRAPRLETKIAIGLLDEGQAVAGHASGNSSVQP